MKNRTNGFHDPAIKELNLIFYKDGNKMPMYSVKTASFASERSSNKLLKKGSKHNKRESQDSNHDQGKITP